MYLLTNIDLVTFVSLISLHINHTAHNCLFHLNQIKILMSVEIFIATLNLSQILAKLLTRVI